MKHVSCLSVLLLSFFLVAFEGLAQSSSSAIGDLLVGNWQPSDARSVISIYKGDPENEEDPNKYYGKIIWLKEPNDDDGNPRKDVNNPEESLQDHPLKGLVILKDLEFVGDKKDREWENGSIYDPKNGSTYSFYVEMPRKNDNLIEARGYIGVSLFGRTDTWKRLVKKG